jgi:predicted NBD/HSP70 family sugar kinase
MKVSTYITSGAVEGGVLGAGDVSVAALAEAAASGDAVDMRLIGEAFHALAARADAEDGPARRIVETAARHLARAIVIQVNLLDLDEVVCGGPFWHPIARLVLATLPEEVRRSPALIAKHPVRVVESAVGEDVAAVGAACLVLDNAFSPRPSAMLIRG